MLRQEAYLKIPCIHVMLAVIDCGNQSVITHKPYRHVDRCIYLILDSFRYCEVFEMPDTKLSNQVKNAKGL